MKKYSSTLSVLIISSIISIRVLADVGFAGSGPEDQEWYKEQARFSISQCKSISDFAAKAYDLTKHELILASFASKNLVTCTFNFQSSSGNDSRVKIKYQVNNGGSYINYTGPHITLYKNNEILTRKQEVDYAKQKSTYACMGKYNTTAEMTKNICIRSYLTSNFKHLLKK
tara:strand:+ start:203 stop:715 length:513 start_codon:yes stop_codon:yes gene_type:complete